MRRAFDRFDDHPALRFAQRTGFADANAITLIARIFFVVRFVSLRLYDRLAVLGVGDAVFDRHNNGFIHFVANDGTDSFFDCHWIWGERGLQN